MSAKKILVLRNYTLEPIFNELKHKFKIKNIKISFDFSSYDSALPEILKMNNNKLQNYEAAFIFFSVENILLNKKENEIKQSVKNYQNLLENTINHLNKIGLKNIFIFYFLNNKFLKFKINTNKIYKLFKNIKIKYNSVKLFNLNEEINLFHPVEKVFDKRYWISSMFPYNGVGLKIIINILYNKIQQLLKFKYKVIILDADNTLWNGVIDEIGYKKINFLNKKKGINYLTFQKKIKKLKNKGLILVLCSKNDLSSIQNVFKYNYKKMILKIKDFLIIKANWNPKYKNILSLQKKLGLSVENSFFIDDSNFEIDSVNTMLPKIDTQNYIEFKNFHKNIDKILISENHKITKEDKTRNKLYSEEFKRSNEKDKYSNFNNYIKNLDIILDIKKNSSKDVSRISQLTQRTNQFNSSAIKLNELDVKKIIKDQKKTIYQCSARDKFGDYGIIGLAIIELKNQTATITNFLMSCRALGREIENYFFKYFVKEIKKSGISKTIILFKKNDKNFLVSQFLKKNCKKTTANKRLTYYEVNMLNKPIDGKLIKINEK